MKLIMNQWRKWKDQSLSENKKSPYGGLVPGVQPSDPNIGKHYTEIAKSEFDNWLKMGNPRHGDRSGTWRKPIAKYWASIKKGFKYFIPQTLADVGSEKQWYGRGKKNPMWSAAFVQYCMIVSGDKPWLRIQGQGAERRGTISNHAWYWSGIFENSLKIQSGEEILSDDWIFIPLSTADQNARGQRSDKVLFTGQDIGYDKAQPGDITLITTRGVSGRQGYHGDIMTSSGPIGGNTTRSGGRVGPSAGAPKIILTKNSEVKERIKKFLSTNRNNVEGEVKNETRRKF